MMNIKKNKHSNFFGDMPDGAMAVWLIGGLAVWYFIFKGVKAILK